MDTSIHSNYSDSESPVTESVSLVPSSIVLGINKDPGSGGLEALEDAQVLQVKSNGNLNLRWTRLCLERLESPGGCDMNTCSGTSTNIMKFQVSLNLHLYKFQGCS